MPEITNEHFIYCAVSNKRREGRNSHFVPSFFNRERKYDFSVKYELTNQVLEVNMNIILWIIFGAIAGWIASIIMGRNAQMGALANIVVGIIGALIGGFIMNAFGAPGVTGFNLTSLIVAIIGAVVLLFLVGLVRRT